MLDEHDERLLTALSRVAEMERRLSEMAALCEREVREAREAGLEEAAKVAESVASAMPAAWALRQGIAASIRALKGAA